MRNGWRGVPVLLACAAAVCSCGGPAPTEGSGEGPREARAPISTYVVNYPLHYFAERIGGDQARVEFPAPSDVDPAYWSPDAQTVREYQRAERILLNGAGYAAWVSRVSLPTAILVDTSAGFEDRLIVIDSAPTHSHGPQGEHSHGEIAFTTWLDPTLAVEQAGAIARAFVDSRPDHAAEFEQRLASLKSDLLALDQELGRVTAQLGSRPLLASHPVYSYLAARYRLNLESVHFEPGEHPDPAAWRELEQLLDRHPAALMLWEGPPLPETSGRLAEMGVQSVVFDPCGNRPGQGDFLSVMRDNAARLGAALGAP